MCSSDLPGALNFLCGVYAFCAAVERKPPFREVSACFVLPFLLLFPHHLLDHVNSSAALSAAIPVPTARWSRTRMGSGGQCMLVKIRGWASGARPEQPDGCIVVTCCAVLCCAWHLHAAMILRMPGFFACHKALWQWRGAGGPLLARSSSAEAGCPAAVRHRLGGP